ncbi:MAG: polysaccharide deacetylase family protein [Thiolinea sp.]
MKGLFRSAGAFLLACLLSQSLYAAEDKSGVVLTFDDTYVDQWHDYFINGSVSSDVKATFFISHWHTLTPAQIQKVRDLETAGHEIGSHSYDHQGVAGDYNFDPNRIDEYLNEQIIPVLANMRADGFDPVSFSYPSGERDETYDAAIRPYFPYLRTTLADETLQLFQLDGIYHNEGSIYGVLAGDGIDNGYDNPIAEIEAAFMRAKTNNEVITLYAHRLLQDGAADQDYPYGIRISKLNQVIAAAQQMGLKFYTFAEAYQVGNQAPPPPESNISVAVEGTRANIRWENMAVHDLIGIVPVGQSEWTSDMPAATTNGSASGKMGITIPALANDQQYVAIFYLGSAKVETSLPFTITGTGGTGTGTGGGTDTGTGGGSGTDTGTGGGTDTGTGGGTDTGTGGGTDTGTGTVTTYMEGSRVRIAWEGLSAHDFIGVVPANSGEWQEGMPGATTSGSASGKLGITVSDAVPGQQYVVIFYNGTTRVLTSQPFVIVAGTGTGTDTGTGDGTDTGTDGGTGSGTDTGTDGGTDTGTDTGSTGTVTTYMEGNRVRIAWKDLSTHDFIGVVSANSGEWQEGMPGATTSGSASGKMGITVKNPVAGQQYVVIFYNAGIRVISSEPFLIN